MISGLYRGSSSSSSFLSGMVKYIYSTASKIGLGNNLNPAKNFKNKNHEKSLRESRTKSLLKGPSTTVNPSFGPGLKGPQGQNLAAIRLLLEKYLR